MLVRFPRKKLFQWVKKAKSVLCLNQIDRKFICLSVRCEVLYFMILLIMEDLLALLKRMRLAWAMALVWDRILANHFYCHCNTYLEHTGCSNGTTPAQCRISLFLSVSCPYVHDLDSCVSGLVVIPLAVSHLNYGLKGELEGEGILSDGAGFDFLSELRCYDKLGE